MMRSVLSRVNARGAMRLWTATPVTAVPMYPACNLPLLAKIPSASFAGPIMHMSNLHTKGDQELFSFLTEEIATEKKTLKSTSVPKSIDGFDIKASEAEVTLTKKFNNETIEVSFNVNHTVDTDGSEEPRPGEEAQATEMRSRPNFEVDIKKGDQILTFSCSYIREGPSESQEDYNDAFLIDEIALYEGEWKEEVYAVAGDILDGYLYDLFMNLLEERGVSNEFVDKLSGFCTDYEHQLYVSLLTRVQNFVGEK